MKKYDCQACNVKYVNESITRREIEPLLTLRDLLKVKERLPAPNSYEYDEIYWLISPELYKVKVDAINKLTTFKIKFEKLK